MLFGREIAVKFELLQKAEFPMLTTPSLILTDFKFLHDPKENLPILIIELGSVTVCNELQV
jgi:hypothetical protein